MSAHKGRQIAVIGGGIGGLTTAIALGQQGAQVTLYEQAEALTDVGAGLQITPNGARVMYALGVSLADIGMIAQAVRPVDALTGKGIARFDLFDQQPAYRFLHRADFIDVLANAARAAHVDIRLGARVAAADLDADLVIAADGLHSQSRAVINGDADPFFTGQVAWRAIIQAQNAPQEAAIWMAPGRHVVTYPLKGNRLNIVAVQERAEWAKEGWQHPDNPENLRAAFADCAPVLQAILGQVSHTHLWQSLRRARVARAVNAANANARNYHLSGVQRRVAHLGLRAMGRVAPKVFLRRLSWLYDHDVTRSGG